ncbi:MAG: Activator of Hsp90 ATPase 1 family protein [Patescibacteria group bacterium]|nr:Activator of Hsp90 ATPase 1 family protein [Patescibacteria group bacterium]
MVYTLVSGTSVRKDVEVRLLSRAPGIILILSDKMLYMHTIHQDYLIKCPRSAVWKALTSAGAAEQWGAGSAKVDATIGGEFSYWGGDIHGTITKIEAEERLEQNWYEHDYPRRLHNVTFSLQADGDNKTIVHLTQTNVGDDELVSMTDGWRDYYFDPIKQLLEE